MRSFEVRPTKGSCKAGEALAEGESESSLDFEGWSDVGMSAEADDSEQASQGNDACR